MITKNCFKLTAVTMCLKGYSVSSKGSSINDVTDLRGKGVKDFVMTVLSVTLRGGESKIVQNCVTSFMDNRVEL